MGILSRIFGKKKVNEPPDDTNPNMKSEDFKLIEPPEGGPIVANYRGKYRSCFIDESGRKVIEVPEPYSAYSFQEGMCLISTGGARGRSGFIDKVGKVIVNPSYYSANYFYEGLAAVAAGLGKWGFIDKKGKMVIPTRFGQAGHFSDGLAPVRIDGKWGFINPQGKTVIPPINAWKEVPNFSEGLAPVRVDDKWGFNNGKGKVVIDPRFDMVHAFSEGLAGVMLEDAWGYIDKAGQWVIEPSFSRAGNFSESLAYVFPCKYIDPLGNTAIGFREWEEFPDRLGRFREGLASVRINDKWGFIDKKGTIVVPIEYESVSAPGFSEGFADVTKDKKHCYINRRGDIVIVTDAQNTSGFSEGLASLSYFR